MRTASASFAPSPTISALRNGSTRIPRSSKAARARLNLWLVERPRNAHAARRWLDLLNGDRDTLVAFMCADDEPSRELRQSTPFAGAIDPRERWRIWNDVREKHA